MPSGRAANVGRKAEMEESSDEGARNAFREQLIHVRTNGVESMNVVTEQRAVIISFISMQRVAEDLLYNILTPSVSGRAYGRQYALEGNRLSARRTRFIRVDCHS